VGLILPRRDGLELVDRRFLFVLCAGLSHLFVAIHRRDCGVGWRAGGRNDSTSWLIR
jgi:hypothetical protein